MKHLIDLLKSDKDLEVAGYTFSLQQIWITPEREIRGENIIINGDYQALTPREKKLLKAQDSKAVFDSMKERLLKGRDIK